MAKKIVKKAKAVVKVVKKSKPIKKGGKVVAAPVQKSTIGILPLADRVVVKPLSAEESGRVLASGIIIPETVSKEKPEQGTVVAVGPGKTFDNGECAPMTVALGDRVLFSKYGYDEVKVEGVEYFIVSEGSVLAVMSK